MTNARLTLEELEHIIGPSDENVAALYKILITEEFEDPGVQV